MRLYAGLFPDRAVLEQPLQQWALTFKAPTAYCSQWASPTPTLPPPSAEAEFRRARMAAETLPNYRPCRVTGAMDVRHFSVLLPMEVTRTPRLYWLRS